MLSDDYGFDPTVDTQFHTDPMQKAPYADCANCPLLAAPCVHSHMPPGSAPEDIELIIVGEAPGYHEVQRNEPFVGPSGRLLYAVLDHIGIAPGNVWKTNAVLCRPPNNDLTRYGRAVEACSKRLQHELAQLPTPTITALGATAVAALDRLSERENKDGILKRRGQWYGYGLNRKHDIFADQQYLATLHPAFVLRSTGYISQFVTDMRSVLVERNDDWDHIAYTVVDQSNLHAFRTELANALRDKLVGAFDVETANLDPRSELLAIGVTWYTDHAWIVPGAYVRSDPDLRETLRRFFDRARLVAHNGKFDQKVLANNDLGFFDLEADTMLLHYMLDEQKGTHGLKQLLSSFVGVPDYEAQYIDVHFRSDKREARNYGKIPVNDLYQYLAIDCCGTLALYNLLNPMVKADDLKEAPQIAIDASNALQYTEHWGIKIDRPYLDTVLNALEKAIAKEINAIQTEATKYALTYLMTIQSSDRQAWINPAPNWIKGTKKVPDPYQQWLNVVKKILDGVSLGSWQQMQVLLYDILKLKHTKKLGFKTDPRSTNQEALDALEYHPFVDVLLSYRRLDKIRGTYVVKLLDLADENDRVHINFNIHGTETGRLSANDGLHGIPRATDQWGKAVRGAFIAFGVPTLQQIITRTNDGQAIRAAFQPTHKLIMADYSQAELRIFAAESKEPFLLEAYNNDEDIHGNTTKLVFPNDDVVKFAQYDKSSGEWYWGDDHLIQLRLEFGLSKADVKARWKELRTTAKNVNFGGLVYLGGANGVAAMIRAQTGKIVTEAQLKPILNGLLANIPTARAWQMDQFRKARDQGFVQSRFGNKRRFMLITEENLDEVKKASVNAPIQNGASQLTLCSGIELTRLGLRIIHYNHDQLIAEVPIDLVDRAKEQIEHTMVGMGMRYYPEVKWRVDIEVGDRWYADPPIFESED